jgi:hypothetical protein
VHNEHQRHFETTASWEAAQAKTLVADLGRIVHILNKAITAEEERGGVFEPFQAEYPMHARELTARRETVADTIAVLEKYPKVRRAELKRFSSISSPI